MPNRLSRFWQELKRRKVLYFLIGYMAACVTIIEFFLNASETFNLPEKTIRLLYLLSAFGIPVVILLPWYIYRKKAVIKTNESGDKESNTKSDKPHIQDKSIIVLPFENISPDPDQEYFSDGLTEEIITDLSHIHDLLVISRSSAMTFKGTRSTVREIADNVNVRYVLEGSVRKVGNNLRITAQLIDGINDSHLWAEKYSGTLDDIFDIQERVSKSIVEALKLKLTPGETKSIIKRPIENIEAYEYYLKARSVYFATTEDNLNKAKEYLEAGLKITGDNAFLFAALSNVYIESAKNWINQEDSFDKAEKFAQKAIDLDPKTAQAYKALGLSKYYQGIIKDALPLLKRGYALDPYDIDLILYCGWGFIFAGKTSEALPLGNRIIELDPFNPFAGFLGVALFYHGEFKEAAEVIKQFITPSMFDIPYARFYSALFFVFAGKINEALDILEPVDQISISDLYIQNARLLKYALQGEKDKIPELMTEEFILAEKRGSVESCWAASFFAILGEYDTALDWLEHAINRGGFINYPYMSQHDPFLTKMKGNTRYDKLMEKVKYEWENFEV